jgi:hypothetical protein
MDRKSTNLKEKFLLLQSQLAMRLQVNRSAISHAGAKGDAAEVNWRGMLEDYLPARYRVAKAFVLDHEGSESEQIDVVVFDRQYSPFLFNQDGAIYVPAESVYAIFEAKQELSKDHIKYAGEKAASVRRLKRTSQGIVHAGGHINRPKAPFRILAGVVCLESNWRPPMGGSLVNSLSRLPVEGRLDLGCAISHGAFEVLYEKSGTVHLDRSDKNTALIFFFLRLLERLQQCGTVPAINLRKYGKSL